jgi:thiol-disulfide isomerase/thioredoxin
MTHDLHRGVILAALMLLALCVRPMRAAEFPKDWTWDDDDKQRAEHEALEGKPMPPLQLSGWMNGEVKPEDMKGKVLVVDFFATWCGPCMRAIPHNNEMMSKYKDKGVLIIGVCTNKNGQDKMEEVVKDKGVQYPTAKDPDLSAEKAWHVFYYPTYAVVDRKGIIRAVGLQPQYVEKVLEKILSEGEEKK